MKPHDGEAWVKEAFDRIPWRASKTLSGLCEKYGDAFRQFAVRRNGTSSFSRSSAHSPYGEPRRNCRIRRTADESAVRRTQAERGGLVVPGGRDHVHALLRLARIRTGAGPEHLESESSARDLRPHADQEVGSDDRGHRQSVSSCDRELSVRRTANHKLVVALGPPYGGWGRTDSDFLSRFGFGPKGTGRTRPTPNSPYGEHQEAQKRGLSLASVRVLADKDYCTEGQVKAVRAAGMTLYGSPQPTQKFLWNGRPITTANLKSPECPLPWRHTSKLRTASARAGRRYARLVVEHPTLGGCALAVTEYVEAGTHKVKRWVRFCTDPSADGVRILTEAGKKRWPVEVTFRENKQTHSYACYQGRQGPAHRAHYACGVLRSLVLEHLFKLSRRKPRLSQGERMSNTSRVARYLSRNVRFTDLHNSEPFLRLRRGSLKPTTPKAVKAPRAAA